MRDMSPVFKTTPEYKVVGLSTVLHISEVAQRIPPLWQLMGEEWKSIPNLLSPAQCFGLGFYPFDFNSTKTFCYMACYAVSSLDAIPDFMCAKVIPAGKHAVFTHRGSVANIHETFSFIYSEWLPKSGCRIRSEYDLEFYDARFKGMADDSELDIYLPVE